jgi:hypothetical protein
MTKETEKVCRRADSGLADPALAFGRWGKGNGGAVSCEREKVRMEEHTLRREPIFAEEIPNCSPHEMSE